ncbi:hypothetical protein Slu03_00040 [Sediminihabitans luteus]|nr:hypothetical protein Slu03_00040 [Sediminihabitans luteus]
MRVFVYGSCVSRDVVEHLGPRYTVAGYVARQSLVSATSPAWTLDVRLPRFDSGFQQRMLDGDARSDLFDRIDAARRVDLVLWDLTDERLGHWCGPGGTHLTRSVELLGTTAPARLTAAAPLREFGGDHHLAEWLRALPRFVAALRDRGLLDRVQPILVPWATTNTAGAPTRASFGTTAAAFNRAAAPYEAAVRRFLPRSPLTVAAPRADPAHRWDEAPFHYTPAVYAHLAAQVRDQDAHRGAA